MVTTSNRLVNRFYSKHKLNTSVSEQDIVLSYKQDDTIVGAAFIRSIPSTKNVQIYLFRSLFVCPNHRQQGIAKSLITRATSDFNEPLYTICSKPLLPFYQSMGFKECESPPGELLKIKTKKSPIIMIRLPSSQDAKQMSL